MKAIIASKGEMPKMVPDFADPEIKNADELLLHVKAVAVKHLDKSTASGKHYSAKAQDGNPKIPGSDAAGILEDGRRVYAIGTNGTMAQKAIVRKDQIVEIPDHLDFETAAALPNAVAGAAMALLFRSRFQKGENVLINGANGVTGRIAVQLARHYGAGKIAVAARNPEAFPELEALGADVFLPLKGDLTELKTEVARLHEANPIHVALDYLWGKPAEAILEGLIGTGKFSQPTRFVSIGSLAGETISLSSQILRSTDLQLCGSGLGSWTRGEMGKLFSEILPEAFEHAASGKLKIETLALPMEAIEKAWGLEMESGKRLVIKF